MIYNFFDPYWDELLGNSPANRVFKSFSPATIITENSSLYILEIILPGVMEKDIVIELNKKTLIISGIKNIQSKTETEVNYQYEAFSGYFYRYWKIKGIDKKKISSVFQAPILRIYLPKKQTKIIQKQSINIKTIK